MLYIRPITSYKIKDLLANSNPEHNLCNLVNTIMKIAVDHIGGEIYVQIESTEYETKSFVWQYLGQYYDILFNPVEGSVSILDGKDYYLKRKDDWFHIGEFTIDELSAGVVVILGKHIKKCRQGKTK